MLLLIAVPPIRRHHGAALALTIERLKLLLAKARRELFGQSSERGKQLIEQLELAIEDLEETQGAEQAKAEIAAPQAAKEKRRRAPRGPRKLPEDLPDDRRRGRHEAVSFDFLGYCFRPRSVKGPYSQDLFCGFTPAVSTSALNAMRATIRDLKICTRTEVTLDDIARELNPKVRGWIAYYGRYSRSALYPMARYINQTLAAWLKRKYKRFHRRLGRARLFLAKIARENRRLFVHWQLGDGGELA